MDIVVTGASGFIGSHLITFLKHHTPHRVVAVDNNWTDIRADLYSMADEVFNADIRDYNQTQEAIWGADVVIHLAANMGGVGFFTKNDYYPYLDNQQMNINILRATEAIGVSRVFFASSACIYPTHLQQQNSPTLLTEDILFPAQADQMYGWDKLMMTMLSERSPLDVRVGIFGTIYGPYQEFEGERVKFPPAIVKKVLDAKQDGDRVKIWGDGTQQRQYLYIDDAVEKIWQVINKDYYGPVNIAGDTLVSCTDVAKTVCAIAGIEPDFEYQPAEPSGVHTRLISSGKFNSHYDYRSKTDITDGFTKLYNWMGTA
jgi:nucleoside-diphosphate-sugar epimerase